jgi:hypothetical protein
MTVVSNRPVPDGFTAEWNHTVWNVGFVFRWSDVYEAWLACGECAVRPGQMLSDAFAEWSGQPMFDDYAIFFGSNL